MGGVVVALTAKRGEAQATRQSKETSHAREPAVALARRLAPTTPPKAKHVLDLPYSVWMTN